MDFSDGVMSVKGIGEKSAKLLTKLNIYTVGDLVTHFPRDYEVFAIPERIGDLKAGETVTVEGAVRQVTVKNGRRNIVTCFCADPSGAVKLVWFNRPYVAKMLKPGTRFLFRGTVRTQNGALCIEQPAMYGRDEYRRLMSSLQPRYSLTKGITHNFISKAVKTAYGELEFEKDRLTASYRREHDLMKYGDALWNIHFPESMEDALKARKRLVFDEFVDFFNALEALKKNSTEEKNGFRITDFDESYRLMEQLPFELTDAQKRVFEDIKKDLSGTSLMCRMIEGDVGSGKTVIAMLAMLSVVKAGYTAALMVPTEVLAVQHFHEFYEKLKPFGVNCGILTGSMTAADKKKAYAHIKQGEWNIVIGTHALIQEKLEFSSLGLVVIDEQHRFGVKQRESLAAKGLKPHIMCMSATPIPRSLSLILYGDMELSVIDTMPAERLPIKNCVIGAAARNTAVNFIRKEVEAGHQAYCICPMIEETENGDGENVTDYVENLRDLLDEIYAAERGKGGVSAQFREIRIEALHGKMTPQQKNEIMERFSNGETDILVSTTVVEVGVNVKNATVMLIENAERFGLAQLHQLRGRVGRGKWQSYCIFVKGRDGREIDERLAILRDNNSGFRVAEEDLRLRGPGDLFGVRQAGDMSWKLADIYADAPLLALAKDFVKYTCFNSPI